MIESELHDLRVEVLRECGAKEDTLPELLAYGERPFELQEDWTVPKFPLTDELHVTSWVDYASDAGERGAFSALKERFVQLRFPIRSGMSNEPAYLAATRKGRFEEANALGPGLELLDPAGLELVIHPSMAGHIPLLVATERADFVALVQAFTERNEPALVPDSMGACIVTGFNNWDRIKSHRKRWEEAQSGFVTETGWVEEFRRLRANKEQYQDRFIILSRGPYSAVTGEDIGCNTEDWLAKSLVIRREHELTHYFTYRVFGYMRNHLHDEVVADGIGLVRAFGHYRPDLALRFLGLESYPDYRQGGRLENYKGEPPLSDNAFRVLQSIARRCINNLETFFDSRRDRLVELVTLAQLTYAMTTLTLEELASPQMPSCIAQRFPQPGQLDARG
jgi:hypothetical protein